MTEILHTAGTALTALIQNDLPTCNMPKCSCRLHFTGTVRVLNNDDVRFLFTCPNCMTAFPSELVEVSRPTWTEHYYKEVNT